MTPEHEGGAFFDCIVCGKTYWKKLYSIKRGEYKFCSHACQGKWFKKRAESDFFSCGRLTEKFIDYFWAGIGIGELSECWEYQRNRDWRGYGRIRNPITGKKGTGAHRIAWIITMGEISDGMQVLHKCDNPPCCNPAHLWLGTPSDNMWDSAKKGRKSKKHRCQLFGDDHWGSKLTDRDVDEIKQKYIPGVITQSALAEEYGVSNQSISQILSGKRKQSVRHTKIGDE